MAIDRITPRAGAAPQAGAAQPGSGGAFASFLDTSSPPSSPAPVASGYETAAIRAASLLADARVKVDQDRQARRHGRSVLEAMGRLQCAWLTDDPIRAEEALGALAHHTARWPEADDPVLKLILRDIAVRAAVEIARARSRPIVALS